MQKISVIVLTKNRQSYLSECLTSIARQRHPPGEVIIVDGSDDPLLTRLAVKTSSVAVPVRILTEHGNSIGHARNLGIRAARFPYVVFLDDDLIAHPSYLSGFARDFRRYTRAYGIVGRTENAAPENPYAATYAAYYARGLRTAYGAIRSPVEITWGRMVDAEVTGLRTVPARKPAFRLTAPYAIDDVEFGVRTTAEGKRFFYDPNIIARSRSRNTLSHLFSMVIREGYYDTLVERRYRVNVSHAKNRLPYLPWLRDTVRSSPFTGLRAAWFGFLLLMYPVTMRAGKAWYIATHL